MTLLIILTHSVLAIILFIITNWIGKHSYSVGYMDLTMLDNVERSPAFNFLFRVLSPVVYLVIFSTVFYKLGLDQFVVNIYLVSIYYVAFRLIYNLITNRARLINWRRQFLYASSIILLSWLTYDSIIQFKKSILPDFTTMSNELWIIIILFLFQVINKINISSDSTERRKQNYLTSRYSKLKKKYNELIASFTLNKKVHALIFAIMLYEDFNRPKAVRNVENLVFRIRRKPMTLGIMQIRSKRLLSDEESVKAGVEKILADLNAIKEQNIIVRHGSYRDWEILSELIKRYNGGKSYNSDVSDLFWKIYNEFYDGQELDVNFEDE